MRKQNRAKALDAIQPKNPVAKFAHLFNRAVVYNDKRKYRKPKHGGLEPFSIALA